MNPSVKDIGIKTARGAMAVDHLDKDQHRFSGDPKVDMQIMKDALLELRKNVSQATDTAAQANSMAVMAINNIAAHEKICDLRYKNIDDKLQAMVSPIADLGTALKSLTAQANRAIGMWQATLGLSVVVGLIYTIVKLTNGG